MYRGEESKQNIKKCQSKISTKTTAFSETKFPKDWQSQIGLIQIQALTIHTGIDLTLLKIQTWRMLVYPC